MSVSIKFENFCNDIRIPTTTVADIQYRYKRITKQLNKDFWDSESETNHSLYAGSYGRDTDVHISDIDMLMRLPVSYYHLYDGYASNGQSALLQAVKESVSRTYNSYMRADGQVVVVKFMDGVKFEIVPCFLNKDDTSFTYPDTNAGGSWEVTNPRPEIKAINDANLTWNHNLKRLCRMVRIWKDHCSVSMSGILIDTLAYNFLQSWPHRSDSYLYYDWMARDFFLYLYNLDENQGYWLAPGSNRRVYKTGNFHYKAIVAYNIAKAATNYEADGKDYSATLKWREIFGYKFKG